MTKEKRYRDVAGIKVEILDYRGILLTKNPLTNSWCVFYENTESPFFGTMREAKNFIDEFEINGDLDKLRKYEGE